MKPVSFKYFAPRTVDDALDLLAMHGEEGKILAGGQSLVPAMNFRLARPASLIDINRIDALDYVREEGGELRIGALARHTRFEAPVTGGALSAFLPRLRGTLGIFRSAIAALSAEVWLMLIRPPNGACWLPHSMPSSSS
jgi:carbon-monoxide dehydrogenase medium subunit